MSRSRLPRSATTNSAPRLLTLDSAAEVEAAIATTIPDIAGGMRALTVAMTDQATGVIGSRVARASHRARGDQERIPLLGPGILQHRRLQGSTDGDHGFDGAGQGVSVGVEWGARENGGRWGAGYTFFSSQEVETHPRETKTNGDWHMLSAYSAWRVNDFYVAPQVNVGVGDFKTRRAIVVGNVGRLASAKTTSYLAAGGATAGYIIDIGNIDIIPTIAVDLMYFNQSAYDEFGGGGMSLSAQFAEPDLGAQLRRRHRPGQLRLQRRRLHASAARRMDPRIRQ